MMFKKFEFEDGNTKRKGVITSSDHVNRRQSKEEFRAFYHAYIILGVDGEGSIQLQKNRFLNKTIRVQLEYDTVFMSNPRINFPDVNIYNSCPDVNKLFIESIDIDLT